MLHITDTSDRDGMRLLWENQSIEKRIHMERFLYACYCSSRYKIDISCSSIGIDSLSCWKMCDKSQLVSDNDIIVFTGYDYDSPSNQLFQSLDKVWNVFIES